MTFQDPMLGKATVAQLLGCCERSLERKVRDGQFPPALRFGKESLWFESVLHAWLEAKRTEQQAWKPRKLRSARAAAQSKPAEPAATKPKLRAVTDAPIDLRGVSMFTSEELAQVGRPVTLDSL